MNIRYVLFFGYTFCCLNIFCPTKFIPVDKIWKSEWELTKEEKIVETLFWTKLDVSLKSINFNQLYNDTKTVYIDVEKVRWFALFVKFNCIRFHENFDQKDSDLRLSIELDLPFLSYLLKKLTEDIKIYMYGKLYTNSILFYDSLKGADFRQKILNKLIETVPDSLVLSLRNTWEEIIQEKITVFKTGVMNTLQCEKKARQEEERKIQKRDVKIRFIENVLANGVLVQ